VNLCALPLAVIGAFVALAVIGHALDLSAIIDLPMLTGSVGTNAIVLLDLVQHRRHSAAGAASTSQRSRCSIRVTGQQRTQSRRSRCWNGCCSLMGGRRCPRAKGDRKCNHRANHRGSAAVAAQDTSDDDSMVESEFREVDDDKK
jgi:hypothetical protein